MKTGTFIIVMLIAAVNSYPQTYQINFTGTGATITVDSVKVENLSQCTSLALGGTDTLSLSPEVGMNEYGTSPGYRLNVYPNPSSGCFTVEFDAVTGNNAVIRLYDVPGKVVLQKTGYFRKGNHSFLLNGIREGTYSLEVESVDYIYSAKLISIAAGTGFPAINNFASANVAENGLFSCRTKKLKYSRGINSLISMQFNMGDTLKLTGKSGNYKTVCMLFPNQSQTVTFNFVKCTDADSNDYAVVQMGSRLWMQENLKTTRYRDGSEIPNVPDSTAWGNLTTGAYCDYHNLPAEGEYYGHLYNYYAVADNRDMCPQGWHVPSHSEWNVMETFFDNTVDTSALGGTGTVIGRILKEGCDTRWAYMDSTYGLNSGGFTALCTNYRTASGSWSQAPDDNHDDCFWTATSYNPGSAWFRSLRWCYSDIYALFPMKKAGYSVRCVKDGPSF